MTNRIASIVVFSVVLGLCSAAKADAINLGAAGDYAVLGLNGAQVNLSSGPLQVNGNVGTGANGSVNFSSGTVTGRIDRDPSASVNISGGTTFVNGGVHSVNFSPIQSAALAQASSAATLTATQTFSSITNPVTISSNQAVNVVSVTGDIHLSGGTFAIDGSASDEFIFNVVGGFELSGNTNMTLSGGITADHVLFNFLGSGMQVQTSGQSSTVGTFLGLDRVFNINGGVHDGAFISEQTLSFQSNPVINHPSPVPLPAPLAASLTLIAGVGLLQVLLRKASSSRVLLGRLARRRVPAG